MTKEKERKLFGSIIDSILRKGHSGQKVVFISGPYRGKKKGECFVVDNIRKAESLAIEVWRFGAVCICPHLNTAFFGGRAPDHVWIKGDLEIVSRCDALLMAEGWKSSVGASHERKLALKLKKPVFYSLTQLKRWLEKQRHARR